MKRGIALLLATTICGGGLAVMTGGLSGASVRAHATLSPIKVGILLDITGLGINEPSDAAEAEASVDAINSQGGINGHKLELTVCDGANDPNTELNCARKLVAEGAVADLDGEVQYAGPTIDAYLEAHNIPEIGIEPLVAADYQPANIFLIGPGVVGSYYGEIFNAVKHGFKRLYIEKFAVAAADFSLTLCEAAAKAAGAKIVGVSDVPITATDYTPYAEAAEASGANFIIPILPQNQDIELLTAEGEAGLHILIGQLDGEPYSVLQKLIADGDKGAVGSLDAAATPPPIAVTSFPELKVFDADMAAYAANSSAPYHQYSTKAYYYNTGAVDAWLAFQAFAKVADTLPVVTAVRVLHAFKTAKNLNLWNLIPNWTPNASAHISGFPRITDPYVFYTELGPKNFQALVSPTPLDIATVH